MSNPKSVALRKLHQGPEMLILPNAWDVASAMIVEQAGYPAVATSSAAVAWVLGYADGEEIDRGEMLEMVARIARAVRVPVTADMEAGYGDAAGTARAVLEAGAVGMNLEDSVDEGLVPLEEQVRRIEEVRKAAPDLVLNARTDAFPKHGVAESVRRANAYLAAGADCAFVPFVTDGAAVAQLAREIRGPLNVLANPALPPLPELRKMGVRRVSIGSRGAIDHPPCAVKLLARSVATRSRETPGCRQDG